MERFVAVLIEHCAGNFPIWLSPDQFAILPISEKYHAYAEKVYQRLLQEDIRGFIDNRDEKIGRKIRDAEVQKVPYMIIVGEKEQEGELISVRKHVQGDMGSLKVEEFIQNFQALLADILRNN
jgi:threonyl-tRNA synthetase